MGSVTLLLGIHNHQPQGNFGHVFARGFEDCYHPFLKLLERHPEVKLTLHYSGPLIDWLEKNHRDTIDTLGQLVDRGQIELLGGGYFEPMLAVLPEQDARGQLEKMAEFLESRIGQRPHGIWLAERAWEPDLAHLIASAGYQYTLLDDRHFLAAGFQRPLHGYYLTDKAGYPLCLFPIAMDLRRAIPFGPVEETINTLRAIAATAEGEVVLTYGDDGEKFGMWPGTKKAVWEQGWLERFFAFLEHNDDHLHTSTFSEVMNRTPPQGRIYPPAGSYDEMSQWALPPDSQVRLLELKQMVEQQGKQEEWGPFIRGGLWQGFMAQYPEANFMHKRMCHVSKRVARTASGIAESSSHDQHKALSIARDELYRGQCTSAYWHGLSGGLYSAKLRAVIHSHLIRADRELDKILDNPQPVVMERVDIDADLHDEVILTGRNIGAIVSAARGGALLAIDDRERSFCITDVLTRRPEAYHADLRGGGPRERVGSPGAEPGTFHTDTPLKEKISAEPLVYDPYQRLAFVDQFFAADVNPQDLIHGIDCDRSNFKYSVYDLVQLAGGMGSLMLCRKGRVKLGHANVQTLLRKSYHLERQGLTVEYEIAPTDTLTSCFFATELSLTLPFGPHPDVSCSMVAAGETQHDHVAASGVSQEVSRIALSDTSSGMSITLLPRPSATVVRFPLETTSWSETGFERVYQGTVIHLLWPCHIQANECFKPALTLQLK